jgi:hypothetical protein
VREAALDIRLAGRSGFKANDVLSWGAAVGFAVVIAG